jgi:hypothetical protein
MQVAQYTFQSPYSSQVQIGRPDTSVKQEQSAPNTNQTQQKAESFAATQVKEVTPTVNTNQLLDVYA